MKLVDTEFELFGSKWKLLFVDSIGNDKDSPLYGEADSCSKIVKIARTINGIAIPEDEMKITLLHELFYVILGTGQYIEYNNDEPLVEWLARCVWSLKTILV